MEPVSEHAWCCLSKALIWLEAMSYDLNSLLIFLSQMMLDPRAALCHLVCKLSIYLVLNRFHMGDGIHNSSYTVTPGCQNAKCSLYHFMFDA